MADGEISVLITAVDNISVTLQNIQEKLSKLSDNSTQATDIMSKGFTSTTDSLLALGNMAGSVEGIFHTYENTQLRLENAVDRVMNAQDRLTTAQQHYAEVLSDQTRKTGDLDKAQTELDRATRNLEISQNNLSRANLMVIANVVTMEVEFLRLYKTLSTLTEGLKGATAAEIIMEALSNPLALGIGLAAAAAGLLAYQSLSAAGSIDTYNTSIGNAIPVISKGTDAINVQEEALKNLALQASLSANNTIALVQAQIALEDIQSKAGLDQTRKDLGAAQFTLSDTQNLLLKQAVAQTTLELAQSEQNVSSNSSPVMYWNSAQHKYTTSPISINIQNVNGLSAENVSRALKNELATKINI